MSKGITFTADEARAIAKAILADLGEDDMPKKARKK